MLVSLRSKSLVSAVLALTAGSLLTSCNSGSDNHSTLPAGVAELRAILDDAGVTALPDKPPISDELFALGQALYFDKELSGNRDISCATCHWPTLASADERTLPSGVHGTGLGEERKLGEIIPRNSPAVLNTHLYEEMFWDGRVEHLPGNGLRTPAGPALTPAMRQAFDSNWELLAAQAMFPVTSRHEMRGNPGENDLANLQDDDFAGIWSGLMARVLAFRGYQQLFAAAYPDVDQNDLTFAHAANAIAAFETQAFACFDSPFDDFVRGDDLALSAEEIAGAREFYGVAKCSQCHAGNTFTDNSFHNTALAQFGPGKGDGPSGRDDFGREQVTGDPADRYCFRTPTLLNIALTAPYGHVGQYKTLESQVEHYLDPVGELNSYNIAEHVSDPDVVTTQLPNQTEVIAALSDKLQPAPQFDVKRVTAFLHSLTANDAIDLSSLVPAFVPSGLRVD